MSVLSLNLDTNELAQDYERISVDRQFKAGQKLVAELGIKSGDAVLDIGSGTGLLAEYAAGIVGPTGSVLGIDPLPLRIELAKRKQTPNLRFQVGNALELDGFGAGQFDIAYLNAVIHWIADKELVLSEIHRVLKNGGRLGITTGAKEYPNPVHLTGEKVLGRLPYSSYPDARIGVPHRVTTAELENLLKAAGFVIASLESVRHVQHHASPADAIRFSEASSFGNYLGHLPKELQSGARADIEQELENLRTPEGIRQDGVRLFAIAVKP